MFNLSFNSGFILLKYLQDKILKNGEVTLHLLHINCFEDFCQILKMPWNMNQADKIWAIFTQQNGK
jgi:hypothetical protein